MILHETTLTWKGRTRTAQYADVYHVRNGKAAEHWHLAVDPRAEEEFLTRLTLPLPVTWRAERP